MVYSPQRRHAVASLGASIQALGLLQHLYTPNALILVGRILAQIQITGAAVIHPDRSLLSLVLALAALNAVSILLHLLDFAGGMNGGMGIILDFIGQSHPASLIRVILIDLLLFILQLLSLIVSYVNNHGRNLPKSSHLPYDDLLLPNIDQMDEEGDEMEDEEADLEGGDRSWARRRRKGKGIAYEAVGDEDELWLNDDDGIGHGPSRDESRHRLLSSSTTYRSRPNTRDPPLIFSLSLVHAVQLLWHLPSPSVGRSFSGGTPIPTPPVTPGASVPPSLSAEVMMDDTQSDTHRSDDVADNENETIAADSDATRNVGGTIGRIPGDYWVGRGRGDGV